MKTIGKHTIIELLPHIEAIAFEYGLKVNNLRDFKLIKKILIQRYYMIPYWD
mgnify:CR=1 FL=1|tara:strand:+ start:2728 stop:2883 length:156 start_codon:yes stop_codon:yes gene_type:complete